MDPKKRESLRCIQRKVSGTTAYVRVTCVLMFNNGRSVNSISEDLGISVATVGYWRKMDGFQLSLLRKELKTKLYTEAKSVSSWISQTFDIHYTAQGCVSLLNRMGFTYKKTSEIPCEADHDRQEEFMEKLSRILEKNAQQR